MLWVDYSTVVVRRLDTVCYRLATALLLYDDWTLCVMATALLLYDDLTLCVMGCLQHCCCTTTGHCVLQVGYSTVVVR